MADHRVFETARLRARPFTENDIEAFVAYRKNPEVARYQSWSDYTIEQGRELVASMQQLRPGIPGKWYQIALQEQESAELVGDLAIKVDSSEPREAEIGFTLAPDQQGKGYATEAVRGLLNYGFATLGLHRVIAVTDALNVRAAALLDRIGMRREGHFIDNVFFKGAWGSEFLFALLDNEWSSTPG
jgi:RimJ/RimL family protein N-acetyltransferase